MNCRIKLVLNVVFAIMSGMNPIEQLGGMVLNAAFAFMSGNTLYLIEQQSRRVLNVAFALLSGMHRARIYREE